MIDISGQRPTLRPYQFGLVEEVLHLIPCRMGGHYFGQPYTLSPLSIYQTVVSPLSLTWYVKAFFFLSYNLDYHFYTRVWGPLMYMYALLGKSHELQTSRSIFSFLLPSPYHLICSILLSSHFHSFSCFHHYLLHLVSSLPWVDDYSHLSAKWIVISLHSSHHLAFIRRFQFERLSHGIRFMYSSVI